MALSNRHSSTCRPLLVLVISLLLAHAYVVNAQNSNNTNTGNVNAAANNNTNSNANSNTNTNTNQNTNDTKGGADPNAKTTPSPDFRGKLLEWTWYPWAVTLLFGGLLAAFAATIIRVILRSKSSFRSPLGLPDGSFRAILAFVLVAFLGFYIYESVMSLSDLKLPESLLGIVATVIGFYFGSRSAEGKSEKVTTGQIDGTVLDDTGAAARGATVDLSQAGVKKLTKETDAKGKFKFDEVPIGEYDIQASLTGKNPSDSAKVKVTAGGTQTINLKLKP